MIAISAFDLFEIGIGPSSSRTVGPMRAALSFARGLEADGLLGAVAEARAELFGSLGATGIGHGSHKAVMLRLEVEAPQTADTDAVPLRLQKIRDSGRLRLLGGREVRFAKKDHLILHRRRSLPYHPNGMRFTAFADGRASSGPPCTTRSAVASWSTRARPARTGSSLMRYPLTTAAELLRSCRTHSLSIGALMLQNEKAWREVAEIRARLLEICR